MALCARDIMQSQVLTISPDEPLRLVQRLFFEEEIHGAPVVDDRGRIIGVLSTLDLLRAAAERRELNLPPPGSLGELLEFSTFDGDPEEFAESYGDLTASDVMTESVVTTAPDSSIPEVATALRQHGIHRVLVVEDGLLCGVVSTFDLVGLLEKEA